jgi:hypothetical protein
VRKIPLVVALLLISSPTLAQQVSLSVTVQEAQYILNSVAAQPWKDANPLMQKLIGQINEQMIPKKAEPPKSKTEPPKKAEPKAEPAKKAEPPREKAGEEPDK